MFNVFARRGFGRLSSPSPSALRPRGLSAAGAAEKRDAVCPPRGRDRCRIAGVLRENRPGHAACRPMYSDGAGRAVFPLPLYSGSVRSALLSADSGRRREALTAGQARLSCPSLSRRGEAGKSGFFRGCLRYIPERSVRRQEFHRITAPRNSRKEERPGAEKLPALFKTGSCARTGEVAPDGSMVSETGSLAGLFVFCRSEMFSMEREGRFMPP